MGGGGAENLVYGSLSSSFMAFFMSEYSLDDPGFMPPVPPVRPSSSESSVEAPVDGRRKCSSCPRRMSKKSADRHTVCVSCRGFDCDVDCRCDECLEWSEEEIIKYAKYRKSLKSRESSSRKTAVPAPPLTASGPSPQPPPQPAPLPAQQPAPLPAQPPTPRPAQRDDIQSQVDSLTSNFQSLSETLTSQLRDFMLMFGSQNQSSCQPRLGPDAGEPHPGETVGESRMFQGEGAPSRTPLASQQGFQPLGAFSAPQQAPYGRAPRSSAPRPAQRASSRQAPHAMPPFGATPQPFTSGWVPPGPPPPRSRHDSSGSESEASESESVSATRDTASARLADLIYEVCPASRPLFDAKAPRCEFEAWFGQPEASASRQRFRMYPRVAEVLEEVAARSESLAHRSRPLSRVIPARARAYAMADDAIFTSSQPVNSAFSQLVGSRSLGARRWGSITFSEMERLERLFQGQLEVTSSSLWVMSGILAMLKRVGFQPSNPALFNSALSAVSAALSRQARTAAAGSTFVRAKRKESLLAHTTLPVPESQKRDLTVAPGPSSGLFDSELLSEVVAQVHSSSQISSNLALSRSLRRGRSTPSSSSSPLTGPRLPSFARGKPSGKRSSSSSRAGSRKRFRGGKGWLLLLGLRVSGGRSHHLSGPFPAVVCPSTGRPGGTGVRSLGW